MSYPLTEAAIREGIPEAVRVMLEDRPGNIVALAVNARHPDGRLWGMETTIPQELTWCEKGRGTIVDLIKTYLWCDGIGEVEL